jgi:tetratricopeptide (TPR) repeat protein
VRTHLALGRAALGAGETTNAIEHFTAALGAPDNLGEARHLLANASDVHFWLGEAMAAAGRTDEARAHWTAAATFKGDFQAMRARSFSEMTYYSARALERLGRRAASHRLLRDLLAYARRLARSATTIDYFATSLPTMLLFEDDLPARQKTTALFLEAQARLGLGESAAARKILRIILVRDPSHAFTADLLSPLARNTSAHPTPCPSPATSFLPRSR